MYYGGLLITGIMMYVLRIPIFILGLVFYNAYVLLIAIAISLGVLFYNVNDWSFSSKKPHVVNTTTNIPTTTRYKCTANDFSNGFARIKYKNQDAYISERYIVRAY